jgi:hypothetical protein
VAGARFLVGSSQPRSTFVTPGWPPKQGSGYGYSVVRGRNALFAFLCTEQCAPVIVAQRLRKGSFRPFDNAATGRAGDAERSSSRGTQTPYPAPPGSLRKRFSKNA